MSLESEDFRRQLLNVETVSPALREAYCRELDSLLHPPLTARKTIPGIILLLMLIAGTVLIAWVDFTHRVGSLLLISHLLLAITFICTSGLIIRDLRRKKHSVQSETAVANLLTLAAVSLTVIALMRGMQSPSDPKSLFWAFYVFVFYFACALWSLERRIAGAELSAREQSLRIECRLAELLERNIK